MINALFLSLVYGLSSPPITSLRSVTVGSEGLGEAFFIPLKRSLQPHKSLALLSQGRYLRLSYRISQQR